MNRSLLLLATLLAVVVIGLGAYVRLSDAGLGCPDWPGCYGHYLGVPDDAHAQAAAAANFPGQRVHTGKAWKEMIHRYAAGTLGLCILVLCLQAWRPAARRVRSPLLPSLLLGLVVLQAALGMWTVTLLLKPVIVTLHLLGGMSTLALLLTLWLQSRPQAASPPPPKLRPLARIALLAVLLQIALGGWVSSNYAALACTAFPHCLPGSQPAMDFQHAFSFFRELGETASGEALPSAALVAIHWLHRLGALLVCLLVGTLAWQLGQQAATRRDAGILAAILGLQVTLGITNVLASLPLAIAVGHTLGAALLLSALLVLNLRWQPAACHKTSRADLTTAQEATRRATS